MAIRKKKITPRQHGAALLKMMKTNSKAVNKYLAASKSPDLSKEEKDKIALEGVAIISASHKEFDEIDKAYKAQNKE